MEEDGRSSRLQVVTVARLTNLAIAIVILAAFVLPELARR
jgi:hypothetical protein